jgi:hypothetical protein
MVKPLEGLKSLADVNIALQGTAGPKIEFKIGLFGGRRFVLVDAKGHKSKEFMLSQLTSHIHSLNQKEKNADLLDKILVNLGQLDKGSELQLEKSPIKKKITEVMRFMNPTRKARGEQIKDMRAMVETKRKEDVAKANLDKAMIGELKKAPEKRFDFGADADPGFEIAGEGRKVSAAAESEASIQAKSELKASLEQGIPRLEKKIFMGASPTALKFLSPLAMDREDDEGATVAMDSYLTRLEALDGALKDSKINLKNKEAGNSEGLKALKALLAAEDFDPNKISIKKGSLSMNNHLYYQGKDTKIVLTK